VSHALTAGINQQFYADLEQRTGWDITLLIPSNWINEYGNQVASDWPAFKGKVIRVPVWKSGNIILHAYRGSMKKILREVNPDVIYVNHEPYAVATAQVYWANRRSIRKPIGFYSCQNIVKKYPPPFRWTESMVYSNSAFSFPITATVDQVHRTKGYRGPSTLMPLGVDPTIYYPRENTDAIRRELGVPDDVVLIGYLGRIVPEKGLITLLRGLNTIREMNWRIAVIGAGSFDAEFDRMSAELGLKDKVIRKGYIPHADAPQYFSAFDVTVLPSETQANWREQFGRVIIESLMCGTPVVGSDSGEIATLINELGGGSVFPERDAAALGAALAEMIRDPALRDGKAATGRMRSIELYATPSLAARFADSILRFAGGENWLPC